MNHKAKMKQCAVYYAAQWVLLPLGLLLSQCLPVHAYIDPSVMTYAIQAVAGILIASGTLLSVLFRRARRKILKNSSADKKYKTYEDSALLFLKPGQDESQLPQEIRSQLEHTKADEPVKEETPHHMTWSMRVGDILPIAALFAVTFGIFMPSSLYLGNVNEFLYDYRSNILPILLAYSSEAILLAELVLPVFPEKSYLGLSSILFSIGLGCYIQGNFLNPHFSLLNGSAIQWEKYAGNSAISVLAWVIILLVPLYFIYKKTGITKMVRTGLCVFLCGVQAVSLFYMQASTKKAIRSDAYVTKNGEWEISSSKNTIVFLVDALDGIWFEDYIAANPQYVSELKDFTYYNDCVGGGAPTMLGVPLLFTGRYYMSDRLRSVYYQEAYEQSHLFRDMTAAGNTVKLYTSYQLISMADIENIANIEQVNHYVISDESAFAQNLYKLTAFYASPMPMKKNFWISNSSIFNEYAMAKDNTAEMFTWDDPQMRIDFDTHELQATVKGGQFVFYHMYGAHGPSCMDEQGNRIPDSEEPEAKEIQVRGAFRIIFDYMAKLKALGLYDDCTFIITADHGGTELYQNPAVLIKKPQEAHDALVTSEAPITFQNVRASIAKSMLEENQMTEDYGKAADEVTIADNTERLHTATRVLGAQLYQDNVWVMTKEFSVYKFHGKARDLENMEVLPIERFDGEHK